jgi:glutaredoxin 2
VIKGLKVPPKLNAYLENFSSKTEIPLYYQMSI